MAERGDVRPCGSRQLGQPACLPFRPTARSGGGVDFSAGALPGRGVLARSGGGTNKHPRHRARRLGASRPGGTPYGVLRLPATPPRRRRGQLRAEWVKGWPGKGCSSTPPVQLAVGVANN